MIEEHIQNIRERGAYDFEKMTAPKDLWPLNMHDELEEWWQNREDYRRRQQEQR